MRMIRVACGVLSVCWAMSGEAAWRQVRLGEAESAGALRGFGKVSWTTGRWTEAARADVAEVCFRTTSPEHARTVLGKYLHDLRKSVDVKGERVGGGTLFTTAGGAAFALAHRGMEASIYACDEAESLRAFLAAHPEVAATTVAEADCPEFFKRFEWGLYGMGGFENFHGWMQGAGARKGEMLDPREDFDFLQQMGGLCFDNWLEDVKIDNADGLVHSNGLLWKRKYAEKIGIPYAYRVYSSQGNYAWTMRRFGEYMDEPADWMMNGWLRYQQHEPHLSWFQPEVWKFQAQHTKSLMEAVKSPLVRGWMHTAGELVHQPWYDMHADQSPAAKASWVAWLKKHGVTLEEASAMYSRGSDAFLSWDDVPVPEFAHFAGLPGCVLDLAGTWFMRRELERSPKDADWWRAAPEARYPGLKDKWYAEGLDLAEWESLKMPGNWDFIESYGALKNDNDAKMTSTRWFRRSFDWDAACAKGKRVYLYFFPMTQGGIHAPGTSVDADGKLIDKTRYHQIYLNGKKIGDGGAWTALDVTDALRVGSNTLAFQLHGWFWNGRIFLSTQTPAVYPNLGAARNRMWTLWHDWRRAAKEEMCGYIFDGMRQADPDAPIKFMAPLRFGQPITNRLLHKYGGYAHFTGEGLWYFPWYKRYGKLYGLQGTSELAGPYTTVNSARTSALRVFLAGLDSHEPVFLTQTYSRNKSVREWWLQRRFLFERMGTYDIFGPQVLIYRRSLIAEDPFPEPHPSLSADAAEHMTPWDWDIGRGSLQSLGQSMLYVDDDGIADGKIYGHKVVFDGGNEIIPAEQLAQLKTWVENGGVYVTFPFTARSAAEKADSWPINALSGNVSATPRPLGGQVTFAAKPSILAAYAGKSFTDEGRVVNCIGKNLNVTSVAFEPAEGTEIVARYADGKAAITVRRLGRGLVVSLGTCFWRDVADIQGIWWPGETESAFLGELLASVGFDAPLCRTNDPLVWAQPYRAYNGMDFVTCLCNFNTNGTQQVDVTLRLEKKPTRLTAYSAEGVKTVTAWTWDEATKTAVVPLALASQEVTVLNAESFSATDAVAYWWSENQLYWRALEQPKLDLTPYTKGKWRHPTQDLKEGARFTNEKPSEKWADASFNDSSWRETAIDVLQFWGAKEDAPAWVRKTFDLGESAWLQGGVTKLILGAWVGPNFLTEGRVLLNGVELAKKRKHGYLEFDVTRLLKAKGNVLAIELDGGATFTGINGNVYLYHRAYGEKSFDLGSGWRDGSGAELNAPFRKRTADVSRQVFIPAEWKGKYKVFLYMDSSSTETPIGVKINDRGRYMRKHHHRFGSVTDIDITKLLDYGADNTITLGVELPGTLQTFNLGEARLELYPITER